MLRVAIILTCCAALGVVVAASAQQTGSGQTSTNQLLGGPTTTNIIGVVFADQTNVVLRLSPASGTPTNVLIRVYPTDIHFDEIITVRKPPPLGDFWLRGEFERLLEQKQLERKQRKE
jgi:hypothetical protein